MKLCRNPHSIEETPCTSNYAAVGLTHLITAHPENGTRAVLLTIVALLQHVAGLTLHARIVFASVVDQYHDIGQIQGYAGLRRPLWPPSWPLWRLETQLWVMAKGDIA